MILTNFQRKNLLKNYFLTSTKASEKIVTVFKILLKKDFHINSLLTYVLSKTLKGFCQSLKVGLMQFLNFWVLRTTKQVVTLLGKTTRHI
jgi:hypothetical protein